MARRRSRSASSVVIIGSGVLFCPPTHTTPRSRTIPRCDDGRQITRESCVAGGPRRRACARLGSSRSRAQVSRHMPADWTLLCPAPPCPALPALPCPAFEADASTGRPAALASAPSDQRSRPSGASRFARISCPPRGRQDADADAVKPSPHLREFCGAARRLPLLNTVQCALHRCD